MKKYLALFAALAVAPFFQSCVAPSGYHGSVSASSYGGGHHATGLIRTSHSRWGYSPFYRSYYDYSLGRYYNISTGRYYSSLPRRYSKPFYPSNYKRGTALKLLTEPELDSEQKHDLANSEEPNSQRSR